MRSSSSVVTWRGWSQSVPAVVVGVTVDATHVVVVVGAVVVDDDG